MKRKSAILPYRFNQGELEILLIKNSSNTKWVIPKGTIETPLQPLISAAKEAYEEAGVVGLPLPISIGTYHKNHQEVPTFLLNVELVMDHYDEQAIRARCWHKPAEITNFVVDEDLNLLIKRGVKVIQKSGQYFKYGLEYFCNENKIIFEKIGKKKAVLIYPTSFSESKKILIKRNKTTVEFLVPTRFAFDSLDAVPDYLAKQFLIENSTHKIGAWTLKKSKEKYVLFRVRNEELKALNSAVFLSIVKNLTNSCVEFEKQYQQESLAQKETVKQDHNSKGISNQNDANAIRDSEDSQAPKQKKQ